MVKRKVDSTVQKQRNLLFNLTQKKVQKMNWEIMMWLYSFIKVAGKYTLLSLLNAFKRSEVNTTDYQYNKKFGYINTKFSTTEWERKTILFL